MIVVNVKLVGHLTGAETDLGTVIICNDGTIPAGSYGSYNVSQMRKGFKFGAGWMKKKDVRTGKVKNHARLGRPIWVLVAKALKSLGHDNV